MKKIVLVTAALLMASGAAFGQLAKDNVFVLTGPGGVSEYAPAPGETFEITLTITGPYQNMVAWSGYLEGAGYALAPYKSDATYSSYGNNWTGTAWTNTSGWSTVAPFVGTWSTAANVPLPSPQIGSANDLDAGFNYAGTGFAFRAMLVAPTTIVEGAEIWISSPVIGNEGFEDEVPAVQALRIIPEPVSALLLLAGLPMLRRRR